jgi:secreted PhoX family phosphatase
MNISVKLPDGTYGDPEDLGTNPTNNENFATIVERRLSRRDALKGLAATAAIGALAGSGVSHLAMSEALAQSGGSTLTFTEVPQGVSETHVVSPGYKAEVVIRWGDKVTADAPAFNVNMLTAAAQEKQFGYNCDYIGYFPLPAGSNSSTNGILAINHEYTSPELMWSGLTSKNALDKATRESTEIEMAAHGMSFVEVRKDGNAWKVVDGSRYNRRVTLSKSPMELSGPVAGHPRVKTSGDATGKMVIGTANNCAGGKTPWGTVLTAEENFNGYFGGDAETTPEAANHKRYGVTKASWYSWWKFHDRFNTEKEPNEPNRFGWMVEIDPYDPAAMPKKRTALGRFKHEGAAVTVAPDGRVVAYSGDDEAGDYLYKFISTGRFNANDRAANMTLLDSGTLYVAQFSDTMVKWLPLVFGQGPLTPANKFESQADVLIETRRAADLIGATKMDRPEDIDVNEVNGRAYLMLTNNTRRKAEEANAVNPRGPNPYGHIVELTPPGTDGKRDHAALEHGWEILLLAGDPKNPEHKAKYHPATSENGWFAAPDNCVIDPKGRLWISTDQGSAWKNTKTADGMWACDVTGPGRAQTKRLFRVPIGAEMCGPEFTPDGKTLFVAVQHPGADGANEDQNFDNPMTRWPDFQAGMPPRPSVVAITKEDGGDIGA